MTATGIESGIRKGIGGRVRRGGRGRGKFSRNEYDHHCRSTRRRVSMHQFWSTATGYHAQRYPSAQSDMHNGAVPDEPVRMTCIGDRPGEGSP